MIKTFRDPQAEKIFNGMRSKKLPVNIQVRALEKMIMLDAADNIDDLRQPPSNHLELLSGDRKGQYSIRINAKYRICFVWDNDGAKNVEIVDYH